MAPLGSNVLFAHASLSQLVRRTVPFYTRFDAACANIIYRSAGIIARVGNVVRRRVFIVEIYALTVARIVIARQGRIQGR